MEDRPYDVDALVERLAAMENRSIDVKRFVALRTMAGLTQEALARNAGVSTSLIKKIEQRRRQVSPLTAWDIADALDCHPNDFTVARAATAEAA